METKQLKRPLSRPPIPTTEKKLRIEAPTDVFDRKVADAISACCFSAESLFEMLDSVDGLVKQWIVNCHGPTRAVATGGAIQRLICHPSGLRAMVGAQLAGRFQAVPLITLQIEPSARVVLALCRHGLSDLACSLAESVGLSIVDFCRLDTLYRHCPRAAVKRWIAEYEKRFPT
ncbi:MAG: hypothetical protein KGL39_01065 [Patescibacteria group bacterium]|nr:hypothetical protein [Patescibacteria group bacterium]